jgi:hypothetical protein
VESAATEAVLAGEMAAVLARWLRQDPGTRLPADAFAVCASGLRSAQWLWLEDDDRAMGCLRTVIEQIARARTWRLRPDRARKIEVNPNSTPRDWIEGAGWKRLNLLNRALGEFAHGSAKVNWTMARNALVEIQDAETLDEEYAQYTGRTHALSAMIFLLAVECAAWTDTFGNHLGDAYRRVIRVDDARADQAIEALLNRAWEKRQTPLRQPCRRYDPQRTCRLLGSVARCKPSIPGSKTSSTRLACGGRRGSPSIVGASAGHRPCRRFRLGIASTFRASDRSRAGWHGQLRGRARPR